MQEIPLEERESLTTRAGNGRICYQINTKALVKLLIANFQLQVRLNALQWRCRQPAMQIVVKGFQSKGILIITICMKILRGNQRYGTTDYGIQSIDVFIFYPVPNFLSQLQEIVQPTVLPTLRICTFSSNSLSWF